MLLFEKAAKCKLRFASTKGQLSVEDLFDLSLESLDNVAKSVNRQLKAETEESFIEKKTKSSTELELKLDILKHIIGAKIATQEANRKRAETLAKKQQITEILMKKEVGALEDKSVEELKKMLEEVSA